MSSLVMLAQSTSFLAAAEGAPASPFAGTIAQSIAAIVVFLVVFYVLKAKAWGPILQGLQDREEKIKKDLLDAEAARNEAAAKLDEYKKQLADAQAQVSTLFANAKKDAEDAGARMKQQAQAEAEDIRVRATKEIDEARKNAVVEVQQQAASLGTLVASKILRRQIGEQDHADLVRQSLDELARK
jgi:F-type H+-transporting ATPase subunit b